MTEEQERALRRTISGCAATIVNLVEPFIGHVGNGLDRNSYEALDRVLRRMASASTELKTGIVLHFYGADGGGCYENR